MAIVDELVTLLGVELSPDAKSKLGSFKNGIESVKNNLAILTTVAAGAVVGIGAFVNSVGTQAQELDKLSQKTGISTDTIQEFNFAAEQMGLNAQSVNGDLISLQKTMSSPIPGQFNATLAMFGVSAKNANGELKTSDQVLGDMADKFQGMSTQKAAQWASKLGISDDTLLLLKGGRENLEQLKQKAHELGAIIPKEGIETAVKFKKQMAEITSTVRVMGQQIAIGLMPMLTVMLDGFGKFIQQNRELISLGLEAFATGVFKGFERVFDLFSKATGAFDPFIDAVKNLLPDMTAIEFATHLFTGAISGLLAILSPIIIKFALIGAAIAAASMLIEDFITYLEGGESVIGSFVDAFVTRYPELAKLLQNIAEFIKVALIATFENLKKVGEVVIGALVKAFDLLLKALEMVAKPINALIGMFTESFPNAEQAVKDLGGSIIDFIGGAIDTVLGMFDGLLSAISKTGEWISDWFGDDEEEINVSKNVQNKIDVAPSHGKAGGYVDNKQYTYNINGGNPQELMNTLNQHDGGNQSNLNLLNPGGYSPLAG